MQICMWQRLKETCQCHAICCNQKWLVPMSKSTDLSSTKTNKSLIMIEKGVKPGDPVRILPEPGCWEWIPATVIKHHMTPRSYIVDTGTQKLRRNQVSLHSDSEISNKSSDLNKQSYQQEFESEISRSIHDPSKHSTKFQSNQHISPRKPPIYSIDKNLLCEQPYITKRGRVVKRPENVDL